MFNYAKLLSLCMDVVNTYDSKSTGVDEHFEAFHDLNKTDVRMICNTKMFLLTVLFLGRVGGGGGKDGHWSQGFMSHGLNVSQSDWSVSLVSRARPVENIWCLLPGFCVSNDNTPQAKNEIV